MKVFVLAAAVSLTAMASAAHASDRHRFVVIANNTPAKMADLGDAALKIDPNGRSVIDPNGCALFRGCATLEDYLEMFQKSDPGAHLTDVNQLPAFFRRLVLRPAPPGQFWMACRTGKGGGDTPVWDCMTRTFHVGPNRLPGQTEDEPALVDPVTGAVVGARDCANPVGREQHEQDCVEIDVFLEAGDELHVGALGRAPFPVGKCKLSVQKTGEQERTSDAVDKCPRDQCDFSGPSRDLNLPVLNQPRISWRARVTGWNKIRVPKEVLQWDGAIELCDVKPDKGLQSRGVAVFARHYRYNRYVVTYDGVQFKDWSGVPATWGFNFGFRNR